MKIKNTIGILVLATIAAGTALGKPMAPRPPIDIAGAVSEWVWRGGIQYVQETAHGTSCSVNIPAHYLLVVNVRGRTKRDLEDISNRTRRILFRDPLMDEPLRSNQVLLVLHSDRLKEMKIGAHLVLSGFNIEGDEFFVLPTYETFTLDGSPPSLADPRDAVANVANQTSKPEPPAGATGVPAAQP